MRDQAVVRMRLGGEGATSIPRQGELEAGVQCDTGRDIEIEGGGHGLLFLGGGVGGEGSHK